MEKKQLKATTRILKDNKLVAIASTEDQDRAGDVLKVSNWNFKQFELNPVLQAGHDYRPQYTIGVAKNLRVEGKKVIFEPLFHEITPLAKQLKQMYEGGFLKAWSVGFIPASDEKGLNELLEVSAVAVPANAYALMKGYEGSTKEKELENELNEWKEKAVYEDEDDFNSTELGNDDGVNELAPTDDEEEEGEDDVDEIKNGDDDLAPETLAAKKRKALDPTLVQDGIENLRAEIGAALDECQSYIFGGEDATPATDAPIDTTEPTMAGWKRKPKRTKAWNTTLSEVFNKEFDPQSVESLRVTFENDVMRKFFDVAVKDLFVNNYTIPSPLLGSYLSGFKTVLADFELVDTRNWHGETEYPPLSEIIQLSSTKSDDFLVDGMRFYKVAGKNSVVIKFTPGWYGMNATIITSNDKKEWSKDLLNKVHKWVKENNYLRGEKFALNGEFIPAQDYKWDDVFIEKTNLDAIQKSLRVLTGNIKSRGLLMMGPPGTGKTMTGKVLASPEVKSTFIWVSSQDMYNVGPIGVINLAFQLARDLSPSILFFEDIDNWIHGGAVDLLKTQLDGVKENKGVLTILTSNNPEQLPDALIDRPGRFHEILNYDVPTEEVRIKMITKWAGVDEEVAKEAAGKTEGFSGSHIKELVEYSRIVAEDEGIEMKDALVRGLEKLNAQKELVNSIRTNRGQIHKSLDTIELKEGRVISKKNMQKIVLAKEALEEVIDLSNKADDAEAVPIIQPTKETPKKVFDNVKNVKPVSAIKVLQAIARQTNDGLRDLKVTE